MLYSLNISPNRHCPSPVKENRYNPMRVSHHIIIHSLKTEYEYVSKETVQNIVSEIVKVRQQVISMVTGVISTTSTSEAIHLIIELKLLSMVINLFPDAFIFWIIINFIIFYAPIDKMYPNKIAYGITCVRQVIEGVIGVIEALIPKYVDEKEPKKKEK